MLFTVHNLVQTSCLSVMESWKPGLNKHRLWAILVFIFSYLMSCFRSYGIREKVFYQETQHLQKHYYTSFFNSLLGVGYPLYFNTLHTLSQQARTEQPFTAEKSALITNLALHPSFIFGPRVPITSCLKKNRSFTRNRILAEK